MHKPPVSEWLVLQAARQTRGTGGDDLWHRDAGLGEHFLDFEQAPVNCVRGGNTSGRSRPLRWPS